MMDDRDELAAAVPAEELAFEEQAAKLLANIAELRRLHADSLKRFGKALTLPLDLDARERDVRQWMGEMREVFETRADALDAAKGRA
jgi:hypothetical protein